MRVSTSDIFDADPDRVLVCETQFRSFGRLREFAGPCATVAVREDHREIRKLLETPGEGRVLVVDGGGSPRVGLMGDVMAAMAVRNGWAGAIVFGAIRDSSAIDAMEFGVKAVATTARRAQTAASALHDQPVEFGGVRFHPGDWVCADSDAVVVRPQR
ncbi:ribonuclease E activity regulator RraA [Pigmentiphaga soli]|uniref:4-hydroxy-4-methyl-2-oxoglutarate aldolase n=1 Tax=Pigmentiphaga soli TaxID=1007095 RepID=A0ABP8H4Y2_9BURK